MISEKIVVVDDDPRIHASLRAILSEYKLVSFQSPQKALEYLVGFNEIKLAIVDVRMKELGGLELLEKLKHAKKDMAVMIITAHGSPEVMVEAMRSHADDFIEKPFDITELKNRVNALLKERSCFDTSIRDHDNRAERIRQFVERNSNNATLKHVADEMCLSNRYVGQLFSKYEPQGFRAYRLKVRMEKAIGLLRRTSLDVSEIGYQLGYQNPESFMRAFKQYVKMTPSQYREKCAREPS